MMKSLADFFGCCSTRGDYEQAPEESVGSARRSSRGARPAAPEQRRRLQTSVVRPGGISPLPLRELQASQASDERARELGRKHTALRRQGTGSKRCQAPKHSETPPGSGRTDQTDLTPTPSNSDCSPRPNTAAHDLLATDHYVHGHKISAQAYAIAKLSPKKSPASTRSPPESGSRLSCLREKKPGSARSSTNSARSLKSTLDSTRGVHGDPEVADDERSDLRNTVQREVRFTEPEASSPDCQLRDTACDNAGASRDSFRDTRFVVTADSDDSLGCNNSSPLREVAGGSMESPHYSGNITLNLLDDAELSPTSGGERRPRVPRLPIGCAPVDSSSIGDKPVKKKISVCLLAARTSCQLDDTPSAMGREGGHERGGHFGARQLTEELAKVCYRRHGTAPSAESVAPLLSQRPKFSSHLSDFSYRTTLSEPADLPDIGSPTSGRVTVNDPAG